MRIIHESYQGFLQTFLSWFLLIYPGILLVFLLRFNSSSRDPVKVSCGESCKDFSCDFFRDFLQEFLLRMLSLAISSFILPGFRLEISLWKNIFSFQFFRDSINDFSRNLFDILSRLHPWISLKILSRISPGILLAIHSRTHSGIFPRNC